MWVGWEAVVVMVPPMTVTLVSAWMVPETTTLHFLIDRVALVKLVGRTSLTAPVDLNTITDSLTLFKLLNPSQKYPIESVLFTKFNLVRTQFPLLES